MEYENSIRILRDVKHAVLGIAMDPNFNYARTHAPHRTVVVRVQPQLDQVQLVTGFATRICWEGAHVVLRATHPFKLFSHGPLLYINTCIMSISFLPLPNKRVKLARHETARAIIACVVPRSLPLIR